MTSPLTLIRCLLISALVWPALTIAQTVNLTVNASQTVRSAPVDERVFGLNATCWDQYAGTPQTVSLLQSAGIRTIRIPGGSLSDEYHWRTNTTLANTWTWASGFDKYIALITGINAQTFVTVNYGTGTAEEAAAWVAYANSPANILGTGADVAIGVDSKGYDWKTAGYWSALRNAAKLGTDDGMNFLRIGRVSPLGLKYWEIGNENYGTWESDEQTVKNDPYTYAIRTKAYWTKMKAVDSTIKIGVVSQPKETDNINNTSHPATNPRTGAVQNGWTPVMLATLKAAPALTPDYLIYHRYDQAPASDQPGNPETDAGLLQKSKTWPADATALRQQLKDYLGDTEAAKVELTVTENNSVYGKPGKQTTSLVNGLFYADSIGNLLQTEFNSLVWWDLRNGQDSANNNSASLYGWRPYGDYGVLSTPSSFGSATAYDPYPTYYVMKLLSNFTRGGDTVVSAASSNTLLSIFAVKRTDGSLSLLVINKDPANTLSATIALTGFSPGGAVTTFSYGKSQDTAAQTGSGSTDIATGTLGSAATTFSASFASYSATVLSLNVVGVAPTITAQPASKVVAIGDSVTFNVVAGGTPQPTYQWRLNGNVISGATGSSYSIAGVTASNVGTYTVVVSNSAGSVTSTGATLTLRSTLSADFNADGQADFLWQNTSTGERSIWLMNGTTLTAGVSLGLSPTEWSIAAVADFNADGKPDLLWQNTLTGDRTFWLMNGTTFSSSASLGTYSTDLMIAGAGDFNSDGKPDLVWQNTSTGERSIWLMNGTNVSSVVDLGTLPPEWSIAGTGDFNADGKCDLIWQNTVTGERAIWLMNGTTVTAGVALGVYPQLQISGTGDYNSDGKSDILWTNTVTGERVIWLMNGTTMASSVSLGVVDLNWVLGRPVFRRALADFNNDGKSDIVWQNTTTGDRAIWIMNGTVARTGLSLGNYATNQWIAAIGDFNNDGKADLVWQNTSTGARSITLLNGTTILSTVALGIYGTEWSINTTGDFNADGKPDLVWTNNSTGDRAIWLMDGTSFTGGADLGNVSIQMQVVGTGDFNSDGQTDILWQNTSTGARTIWLMNGTAHTSTVTLGTYGPEWSIVGTGDYNADGKPDLLWQNTITGERAIWLMSGTTFLSSAAIGTGTYDTVWSIRN